MAELTISAADIEGAIEDYVSSFSADTEREEVGTVIDAGDGIAHVEGLPSVDGATSSSSSPAACSASR